MAYALEVLRYLSLLKIHDCYDLEASEERVVHMIYCIR